MEEGEGGGWWRENMKTEVPSNGGRVRSTDKG